MAIERPSLPTVSQPKIVCTHPRAPRRFKTATTTLVPTHVVDRVTGDASPVLSRFLVAKKKEKRYTSCTSVTLEVNATVQLKPSGEPQIRAKVKHKPEEEKHEKEHGEE